MKLFAIHRFAGRTLEAVALRLIEEETAVEQGAVALVVDGAVGGHMGNQPGGLAAACLLAVGVARVGDDVQAVGLKRLLRGLRHRLQRAAVGRIQRHRMGHDQSVFGFDRILDNRRKTSARCNVELMWLLGRLYPDHK
jgi:hypothetical protein